MGPQTNHFYTDGHRWVQPVYDEEGSEAPGFDDPSDYDTGSFELEPEL